MTFVMLDFGKKSRAGAASLQRSLIVLQMFEYRMATGIYRVFAKAYGFLGNGAVVSLLLVGTQQC
ncbi:hypothetical protein HAV22_18740 [Massilia sp. TW-1]|uniref:Uncharacterized protein n=1 Tax=Telluria antibiotica TaxID=2717319 RepID=A0ABX0PFS1_9BURK|nr:hypothetical protein [Telluria antibiotica]NIA55676.1 hypothetical protein [Telluria antibiotica]